MVESRQPRLAPAQRVWGTCGGDSSVSDGSGIFPLAHVPDDVPLSYPLSIAGINGVTAHLGMIEIGRVAEGETVVVSSAAGARLRLPRCCACWKARTWASNSSNSKARPRRRSCARRSRTRTRHGMSSRDATPLLKLLGRD